MDFHVAGALEFFVDHVVHARTGVDQRGGNDGQRAAFFDVACGAKEAFWPLQCIGVHAAGQHLARSRHNGVVGAREPRYGIEQNDDVLLVFDQTLGFLQHHLGNLYVARGRFIERRGHHLAFDRTLHFGNFFGALIDQQNDQVNLGKVCRDGMSNVLQHHGLAAFRTGHQQAALTLADRGDDIDDASGQVFFGLDIPLHLELLSRKQRGEIFKQDLVLGILGRLGVDFVDFDQREVALAVLRGANLALD